MRGLQASVREAFRTKGRVAAVLGTAVVAWVTFVLLTRPIYAAQLLSASPGYLAEALSLLVWNQYVTNGALGILLPVGVAFLIAIVAVTTVTSLLQNYHAKETLGGVIGGVVGFAGAGCATCGAGVLALLGLAGSVAILPFGGIGVQLASLALLLGVLEYNGRNAGTCAVSLPE